MQFEIKFPKCKEISKFSFKNLQIKNPNPFFAKQKPPSKKMESACSKVRSTSQRVIAHAKHVHINPEALKSLSVDIKEKASLQEIDSWSESHLEASAYPVEQLLRYIFLIDTLNFCFWPHLEFEYCNLAKNIASLLKNHHDFFTIPHLAHVTEEELKSLVFQHIEFCLLKERARMVREVFTLILKEYEGSCEAFVKNAGNDAVNVIGLGVF